MNTPKTLRSCRRAVALILAGSIAALLASPSAQAVVGTWLNTGAANGLWSTPSNWTVVPGATTGTTNADSGTFNTAVGNFGTSGSPVLIDANRNLFGLNFLGAAGNYFIGTTGGNPLLLTSAGVTQIFSNLTATNAVETINAPLVLEGASSNLINNSANGGGAGAGTFIIGGGITGVSGNAVLSLGGSNTNANTISGIIGNGAATSVIVSKGQTGTWVLTGANTNTGNPQIADGILSVNSIANTGAVSPLGTGSTIFLGGLGSTNNAKFQFTGVGGGSSNRTFNLQPNGFANGGGTIENTVAGQTLNLNGSVLWNTSGAADVSLGLTGAGDGILSGGIGTGSAFPARASLIKSGAGTWTLSGANVHIGDTTVNGGTLKLGNAKALGFGGTQMTTTGITTVNAGFTLDLNGATGISEPITLNGAGIGGNGALVNSSGISASVASGIAGLAVPATGIGSGLSAAPAVVLSGTGTGATATAKLGLTTASITSVSGGTGWVTGDTVIVTGAGGNNAIGTVTASGGAITGLAITSAGAGYTTAPLGIIRRTGSGSTTGVTFTGNATNFTVGGLALTNAGTGYTGTPTATIGGSAAPAVTPTLSSVNLATGSTIGGPGDLTINAAVSGAGLGKVGAGTLTLAGANTYTGNTAVSQGRLTLSGSGSFAGSPNIAVASGATLDVSAVTGGANHDGTRFAMTNAQTLRGTGTVLGALDVSAGATIAPGNSIGRLGIAGLSLTSTTSHFAFEIDLGLTPAADLLNVTGGISLAGSTLDLSLFNLSPMSLPETFLFAANDLSDPVTGTFGTITGVPDGYTALVDYAYTGTDALGRIGDGNDLAVTLVAAVPEPGTALFGAALIGVIASRRRRSTAV